MPAKRAPHTITPSQRPFDVAVLGGGVAGLAVAWRARTRGLSVCVLDRGELGAATSRVAAGMLAPVTEADAGERALLALGLDSARRWPAFADELLEATGVDVGYRRCGTLVVARDRDEAEALDRELALRGRLGLEAERLLPSAARRAEPALAPTVRLALEVPDDHAVDPRLLTGALARAAERAGVVLRPRAEVTGIAHDGARVQGLELRGGERVAAGRVVVAAGPWSGGELGLPTDARVPVRPVKGQTVRLRDPGGPGLLGRVVRFDGGYLVPRADGRLVLGATVEERGFDASVTAWAVHELLRDAAELVPGVLELEVEELLAGLRPGTPDNAPILGASRALDGLVWATGHHRNGILLAPVTAELVAAELAGEPAGHPFGPGRFARAAAVAQ
jgi:glycine oxidase